MSAVGSVILSAAKDLLFRGPEKILRFAQNDSHDFLLLAVIALQLTACEQRDDGTMRLADHRPPEPATPVEEAPVAINPVSPVRYPPALLEQGIEGQVLLRLFVDSSGTVIPDSTRVAESSGYPALDSAALVGAPQLRFSPPRHQGRPVAAPFLQPVQFRSQRPRRGGPGR